MKELLKKYYGIEVSDYSEYEEGILFIVDGVKYYFTKCHYDKEYIAYLFQVCQKFSQVPLHHFVFNKNGEILSEEYVLLRLYVFVDDITLYDIERFQSFSCDEYLPEYLFMDKFWEDKIDYLEMQLSELSDNKLINNSFDYYVGVGEILISYLKKIYHQESIHLCLSHKCLPSLSTLDFYNPLHISFDHPLKDLASYIRITGNEELLLNTIDQIKNKDDFHYFFVRMVFPFSYFYEISNVLVDKTDEKKVIMMVNQVTEYEEYLWRMEKLFGIYLFSWIKKE